MRFRTWPVAALGLGGLLLLVMVTVMTASRRAQDIYARLDELNARHHDIETKLRRLRSDVHLSGIFIRDYLLDFQSERDQEYRDRLTDYRRSNEATLAELRVLAREAPAGDARVVRLQERLEEYWQAYTPMLSWTSSDKVNRSARFLSREVLPRREAVMLIAQEIEELNDTNLAQQREEVTSQQAALRQDLSRLLWQSLLLGLVVAVSAVVRLRVLERRSEADSAIRAAAEQETRRLSREVVAAHEEERRVLSRELHDHVGQMLTALRMELGRIDRLRSPADAGVAQAVAEGRALVDSMVRTVRDLALGLRPMMLDDFGLHPALEWLIRDVSRRFSLPITLSVDGDVDSVPDRERTCAYRAVQEALTNAVRHAKASHVSVVVRREPGQLEVSVADDGVGIGAVRAQASGLGLRGIEERVRELGGEFSIENRPGSGAVIALRVPVPAAEVARARAAG